MTRITPGIEHAIAICHAPGCGWAREAVGRRNCEKLMQVGQRHADHKGHPVAFDHKHTTVAELGDP